MKSHIIYEDNIDLRHVKCSCGKPECKIGVSFDSEPDVMRLHDKFGNEHSMRLDKKNVKQIIARLNEYL